jgi:hypothetical protein
MQSGYAHITMLIDNVAVDHMQSGYMGAGID